MAHNSESQVVVVTGASAGVGRATARAFAKRGARVALIARGHTGLAGAVRDVEELGGVPLPIVTDVSDYAAVESAAEQIERELGPIDVWVNNAMVSEYAPVWEMTPDEFKHIVDVTLLGQVYGTMAALKRMRPRDRGVVVHVGSALSHRSIPLQSAYCASKHGVNGFVESLRTELMYTNSHVRVVIVSLPGLNTPQFEWTKNKTGCKVRPVGRIYQPEVAAEGIVFASQHDRKELLVGWPTVQAVTGEKVASGLLDRYIADTAWDGALESAEQEPGPDNFWAPVEHDFGAHGRFDTEAQPASLQLWANTHRKWIATVGLAIVAAGVAIARAVDASERTRHARNTYGTIGLGI
jgi:NAD(P)-dependent dehydrogenase (short-subunit alcohol dehydrogenase family)